MLVYGLARMLKKHAWEIEQYTEEELAMWSVYLELTAPKKK